MTVIEVVVALSVLLVVMTATIGIAVGGYRTLSDTRFYQQGTAVANGAIELIRDIHYDDLVMQQADLAGDSQILTTCGGEGGLFYDPDGAGADLECEELVYAQDPAANPAITPHVSETEVAGKIYTVSRYLTWAPGATADVCGTNPACGTGRHKRLSVLVEWQGPNGPRSYMASTFITAANRGLPDPRFDVAPSTQTFTATLGAVVDIPLSVTNRGILDAYDITLTDLGWQSGIYHDTPRNEQYDIADDPALTDTNASGRVDTGNVATDVTSDVVVRLTVPPLQALGTYTVELTATSGIDDDVSQTVEAIIEVVSEGEDFYLHDDPSPPIQDENTQANLAMDTAQPIGATLYRYSKNTYNSEGNGRYIEKGGALLDDLRYHQNWVFQMETATTLGGTAELKIWVAPEQFQCDKAVALTAYVRSREDLVDGTITDLASGAAVYVPIDSADGASDGKCGFAPTTMTFQIPADTVILANHYLELRLGVEAQSAGSGLFAYDTIDTRSRLRVPIEAS